MLALLDTSLFLSLCLSFLSSSLSPSFRPRRYFLSPATCTRISLCTRIAIYAYVYLCTKRSAHTCRARNISRVRIELCHPSFSLFSRSSFPIRERGTRVSRQIDLPPGNACCTRCEQTRTSKRFEDRVIFTPANCSFFFYRTFGKYVRARERKKKRTAPTGIDEWLTSYVYRSYASSLYAKPIRGI